MPRVFLSHSSKDKDYYVRIVAEKLIKLLGEDRIVYDEYTFEEGMKSIEEIDKGLEVSDLFVLFISNTALNSEWVKYELIKAKDLFSREKLERIYPIIIDKDITFDDNRIPKWLRDYNLKYISRPSKAVNMINQRLREISWKMNPRVKERENIFVGRNDYIKEFEERVDSIDMQMPNCFIISGFKSIGRSSFIKHCFRKANLINESYQLPVIYLDSDESLEDFILKIYDLGFSESLDLSDLMTKTIEEKIEVALIIIKEIQKLNEKIMIRDDGGIVNHRGELSNWFYKILNYIKDEQTITFCVIAKFRLHMNDLWRHENIFYSQIAELDRKERLGLLKRYLKFEDIDLRIEEIKMVGNLLSGYPEQVFFAVDMIKKGGIKNLKDNTDLLCDFNSQKVSSILIEYEDDERSMEFLCLLSEFDYIGYDFIYNIVGEDKFYPDKLEEFFSKAICESAGSNKEYIRVNQAVRDYIQRSESYAISDEHQLAMKERLSVFLDNPSIDDYNIPEFLFSLKESLLAGNEIDSKLIIPSLYLKTMTELYEQRKDYKEVIIFADKALENSEYMDKRIIFEIRYLLCLSLAKRQNERLLDEVRHIEDRADRDFLLAFYYRQIGKNDKALEALNRSLDQRSNFSKAKRELVQVYLNLQEYSKATELAKQHYENDKSNIYHIQAYFNCLVKSDIKNDYKRDILKELISNLERVKSEKADDMLLRCKAQFEAFINNDEEEALMLINESIDKYPHLNYGILVKFDICEKFKRITDMKKILQYFKENYGGKAYNNTIVIFTATIMAIEGNVEEATTYFKRNIRNYTEQAIDRFTQRLIKYN